MTLTMTYDLDDDDGNWKSYFMYSSTNMNEIFEIYGQIHKMTLKMTQRSYLTPKMTFYTGSDLRRSYVKRCAIKNSIF